MRISQRCGGGNRRCVEAASSKFEHCLNLLPRYMKLLDDFLDARTRLEIFKNRNHRHPGIAEYPCSTTSVRHAFDGGTLGPIERCHGLILSSKFYDTVERVLPPGHWPVRQ